MRRDHRAGGAHIAPRHTMLAASIDIIRATFYSKGWDGGGGMSPQFLEAQVFVGEVYRHRRAVWRALFFLAVFFSLTRGRYFPKFAADNPVEGVPRVSLCFGCFPFFSEGGYANARSRGEWLGACLMITQVIECIGMYVFHGQAVID